MGARGEVGGVGVGIGETRSITCLSVISLKKVQNIFYMVFSTS